jgi:hypothetical protein
MNPISFSTIFLLSAVISHANGLIVSTTYSPNVIARMAHADELLTTAVSQRKANANGCQPT